MANERMIKVTGKGNLKVKPDVTRITITLEGQNKEYDKILEQSSKDMEALKDILENQGLERSDVKTLIFNVDTRYESYQTRDKSWRERFVGYEFKHVVKVEFDSDNTRLGKILFSLANAKEIHPDFRISYTIKDKEASKNELLGKAIADAKAESTGEVIIESFMQGTEITCGCYTSRDGLRALPITEVCPKDEFFDLDAKYNGAVEEITPARISAELTAQVQETTKRIYRYVGAKGIIRVDYIIVDGVPHLLEVNTTPGMTATSFIPQEVRAAGLNISDVMDDVIDFSLSAK